MSLPNTQEPTAAPIAELEAPPSPTPTMSWSQQLKERLDRLAKATSAPVDPYPGTPAYIAAHKLEETIEATWRAYLVELVRNDLAAGVVAGRRKHHWEKNECLIVYELIEGSELEEFPSSDVVKREEYLARTVKDALYIKVPQFSGSFTFPWPSPKDANAKLPDVVVEETLTRTDIKLRAASLATPPESPPPEDDEALGVSQQPIQRRTVSYPLTQSRAPAAVNGQANPPRIQLRQSDNDKVTLTPSVVLTPPALHAFKSTSVPNSPINPPSALASALIGVGTAHALGSSSPCVHTSDIYTTLSDAPENGRSPLPVGLGLGKGTEAGIHSLLGQVHENEHDYHEVATIQRARRASVATATFKTLNPVVGLDAEIGRRSRPSSPIVRDIPAPELVYYGSGANSVEEDDEESGEMPVEMFKSLNPHVSLEAEIARRSCPPSPTPQVFVAPHFEDDDEPIETFKSLNPAVSLDAEILRRSRTPSPVPQFKELNKEFSLEREIAKRAASRPASPNPMPVAEDERFADDANEAENSSRSVAAITPNRSLARTTFLLPFILGLRIMNIVNPFAYLYLARSRSRSTHRPESYPKIPRSVLRMVVPAFIWRWAGKDPSYNLQRVGLGKGVNTVGTQYDKSGAALPPTSA